MFELNNELEVIVVSDIGPSKKRAVIVDNFYKNPDEIREICLTSHQITPEEDAGMVADLPGNRVWVDTEEVKSKLYDFFMEVCFDPVIWNKMPNIHYYQTEWQKSAFMCNVVNDSTLLRNPSSIIPHQDSYPNDLFPQFGALIYLNTPEECCGGTNFYSFNDEMTILHSSNSMISKLDCEGSVTPEEEFAHIRYNIINGDHWKCEHTFEMKYNRMLLYEADVLHGINVDLGMFTNFDRINQILFM